MTGRKNWAGSKRFFLIKNFRPIKLKLKRRCATIQYAKMCISTIYLKKRDQEVTCGKCYECVKRRRNDWYIRCLLESRARRFTYFGLLTYAEVGQNLLKRDIQLFLKRLRIKGYTFKYLIAGEYGEKKKRAHWHCLFFSDYEIPFAQIANSWRGGYDRSSPNSAGWIRFEKIRSARSIRYTVKYLYKYDGTSSKFELMMSKNPAIGKGFVEVNQRYFLDRKSADFTIDGRPIAMPRYFKRKIFEGYEDIKQHVNQRLHDKVVELAKREVLSMMPFYPNLSYEQVHAIILEQKHNYNEFRRIKENN